MASEHELLWAEKYRPRSLDEIVDQEDIVARLKKFVQERNTPHLLFAGPPGTGKCVTGDTLILTPMGPRPIGEIVEGYLDRRGGGEKQVPVKGLKIYTLNARGNVVEAEASHVYRGAASKIMRLKTRMGREIGLTARHPLLVNRGGIVEWIPASNIRVGDRIAVPRSISVPEKPLSDEDERRIVLQALLLGAERKDGACRATCVSRDAARLIASSIGVEPGEDGRTITLPSCRVDVEGLWGNSKALRILVKSYLECFSHVSSRGVEVQAGRMAAELLSYAMLALGIVARITDKGIVVEDKESLRRLAEMRVYSDARRSLLEEVVEIAVDPSIPIGRLAGMLLGVLGDAEALVETGGGEIPAEKLRETALTVIPRLQEELLRMEEVLERSRRVEEASGPGRLVAETSLLMRESTLSLYKQLSEALYSLVFLSRADIYWDTVTDIRVEEGETTVYDLTVPGTGNFVGGHGPVILHNTTAALAFAHDLYGEEYPRYLLELNASVTGDTPLTTRINGEVRRLRFSELERIAESIGLEEIVINDSRYIRIRGVEVPSYDAHIGHITWSKASWLIKHKAPWVLRIKTRSGAELGLTGNHSVVIVDHDGRLVEARASELKPGSLLIGASPGTLASLIRGEEAAGRLSDPLPSEPFKLILKAGVEDPTITREEALRLLSRGPNGDPVGFKRVSRLASAGIMADEIIGIRLEKADSYVYDLSVPGREVFFAGSKPILLHNSDERGIETIRTKVKEFARSRVAGPIPFKLVLLDEADNMTADAQQALRRLMELYTATTRFILIANFPSKIIEPIQSRCAFFRFTPLRKEDVIARLKWIADQEGAEYDPEGLETIYEVSEGDMRKAINLLQAAAALGKVTTTAVYKVVGMAHPREVREMISLALRGDFTAARDKLRKLMIEYGLSGLDIVKQMHREIFSDETGLSEEQKVLAADYIGEIQFRLVEGGDDEIQLNALLAWLALLGVKLSRPR